MWERELMTSKEVAQILGISQRHLATLKKKGLINYFQHGRLVRYRREDVDAYIMSNLITKKEVSHG